MTIKTTTLTARALARPSEVHGSVGITELSAADLRHVAGGGFILTEPDGFILTEPDGFILTERAGRNPNGFILTE